MRISSYKSLFFHSLFFCIFMSNSISADSKKNNIALLLAATGKYITFVPQFLESAKKFFCINHNVTFFIFTDGEIIDQPNVVKVYQKRLGWPHDSMLRCEMHYGIREILEKMDYVFAIDVDMRFVGAVGDEILSARVGTLHPWYAHQRGGPYERNPISRACIASHEGQHYFAGGFFGGNSNEFLKITKTMIENINYDLEKKFIAYSADESHLNRYFINNPPTQILSPSYCYPEGWNGRYAMKILALEPIPKLIRE